MIDPQENRRLNLLKKLVVERFGALSKYEMAVLTRSVLTDYADVTDSDERPSLRSDFLQWLASDAEAAKQLGPLGIRAYNATVTSPLQLSFQKVPFAMDFRFCTFTEPLWLQWAEIPSLYLFRCKIDTSIWADGVRVSGDIAVNSCEACGKISVTGAVISGNLNCSGTKFTANGETLDASGAKIAGNVYLSSAGSATSEDEAFVSAGTIQLFGTDIGGNLVCSGARLLPKTSLLAESAKMRNLYLDQSFSSHGLISLLNAQIEEDFNCRGAYQFDRLVCDRMRVGARMIYKDIAVAKTAEIDLFGASVGALHDDQESWPGDISLDGFVYQELILHDKATPDQIKNFELGSIRKLDPRERIRWLRLQPDAELNNAQPWMQLAKVLVAMGDANGAKHVIYEFHRQQASNELSRPISFVYDTIEEQPLRIGWFIALFWAFGSLVFWRAKRMGAMKQAALQPVNENGNGTSAITAAAPFHPFIYALENVLPVVKLGEDSAWTPDPNADGSWLPDCHARHFAERWRLTRWLIRLNYQRLTLVRWTLILVGWALALILAAAIGEQFKR